MTGNAREDAALRQAQVDHGHVMQAMWGCPAGGHKPCDLPPDLRAEARAVAAITGTAEATTCPFACLRGNPWLGEVTEAAGLAAEYHVALETTLGRRLTHADVRALATLKRATAAALASDRELNKSAREKK